MLKPPKHLFKKEIKMFIETIIGCVIAAAGYYFYRENKKDNKQEVALSPTIVSNVGKYVGQLAAGSAGVWGGVNDEHDKAYTESVLASRPDWRGLGYCPAGSFEFEVQADGAITGSANIYGHICPVQGRPVLAVGANEIEFTVLAHMVKLKFENGKVSGLLWEGHDLLKRANIVGQRV